MRCVAMVLACSVFLGCATTAPEKGAVTGGDGAPGIHGSGAPARPGPGPQGPGPRGKPAAGRLPPGPSLPGPGETPAAEMPPRVAAVMERMSLRERIAQRFITFIPRDFSSQDTEEFLRKNKPGGVVLYPWNCRTSGETRSLSRLVHTTLTRATGGVGPIICADQEGGRVRALRFDGMIDLPSPHEIGRGGSATLVGLYAYVNAVQMKELGFNMNLAPVLDISETGDRSIVGDRSYGGDPRRVGDYARAYIAAAAEARLIPVAKHFPGHGITRVDSHGSLPVAEATAAELMETHILPFRAAVEAGIQAVMTAHILYPAIDADRPATLSRRILTDILRRDLGFDGVIISDGLEMGALSKNYSMRETLRWAIIAGVDLMLAYLRYPIGEMIDLVEDLVAEGELTVDDIDRGTERVLRLKLAHGLLDGAG